MLKPDHIDFLLVPDAPSGRRVRKAVATRNLGFGVKVGTCLELVEAARLAFVIPPLNDDWYEIVRRAIEQGDDGFWQHSYRVDPVGTASEIAGALEEIIRSGETHDPWLHEALPRRASRILADLRKFWSLTGEVLPPELNLIREIRASPGRAISRIAVYRTDGWPRLDTWQAGLVNSLNEAAGELNPIFLRFLRKWRLCQSIQRTYPLREDWPAFVSLGDTRFSNRTRQRSSLLRAIPCKKSSVP